MDAAPLIVNGLMIGGAKHNVVYVASEHDSVYAYDVDTGSLLLQVSLLPSKVFVGTPSGVAVFGSM